jgi:hypothetical protein
MYAEAGCTFIHSEDTTLNLPSAGVLSKLAPDFREEETMKSIREESTNETQPISWIQIGVAWKVAADAVLSEIQHEGSAKVGIQFGDSVMKSTTTICQNVLLPPIYMTMAGFAVENLMKGIVIRDDPKLIEGKYGRLNKDILNHRLIRLVRGPDFVQFEKTMVYTSRRKRIP